MDKYIELMNRINTKYSGEEVEQTENIISLWDLVSILKEEMQPFYEVRLGHGLRDKINKDRNILQRMGILRRNALDNECRSAYTGISENRNEISIAFKESGSTVDSSLIIIKDRDSDELYFADFSLKDRDFVTKYLSEIYHTFAVLEQYVTLFPYEKSKGRLSIEQNFNDGVLTFTITCDTYGRVNTKVEPSVGADPDKLYKRTWYNREKVSDYVNGNAEEIMRRIPVQISELEQGFKKLVEDNLSKKNAMKYRKSFGMAN